MLPNPPAMLDESERKLYTLLALRELGSCNDLQLLYFMVDNEIMTYFDLSLALPELVNEGHAARLSGAAGILYQITDAGKETLSFFVNRLPHSKATQIIAAAPDWREKCMSEKQFPAQVIHLPGGACVAQLRLMEENLPALSLDIPLPDRATADRIVRLWPQRAGDIYRYLMSILDDSEEKP